MVTMNRLTITLIIAAALFIGIMAGCEEEASPTSSGTPTQLFPINNSSSWVYEVEARQNDSLLYRSTDEVSYDSSVVWGGSLWYGSPVNQTSIYWRNGVDGVWRLKFDDVNPAGVAEKYYAFPAEAGETWYIPSDDDTVNVVSTSEVVEVPAGTFDNCYYYRIIHWDRSRRISVWIKPGTGIVQESRLEVVAGDTLTWAFWLK